MALARLLHRMLGTFSLLSTVSAPRSAFAILHLLSGISSLAWHFAPLSSHPSHNQVHVTSILLFNNLRMIRGTFLILCCLLICNQGCFSCLLVVTVAAVCYTILERCKSRLTHTGQNAYTKIDTRNVTVQMLLKISAGLRLYFCKKLSLRMARYANVSSSAKC